MLVTCICVTSISGLLSKPTYAQGVNNIQNIPEELEAQELYYKGFLLEPRIDFYSVYDSNVFSEPDDEKDDFVFRLKPQMSITKEYDGHIFEIGGEATAEKFSTYSSEDALNYEAYAMANFRANSRWEFPFSFEYFKKARNRNRPDSTRATTERTYLEKTSFEGGFKRTFNRLSVKLLGHYFQQTFEDGVAQNTGAPVIFSDKDNQGIGGFLGLEYALIGEEGKEPDTAIFANYRFSQQTFDSGRPPTQNGVVISSDNFSQNILLGYKTNIKDRLFLKVAGGLIHRSFDSPGIKDAMDYDVEAEISYIFRPKLSFILNANRDRDDSNDLLVGLLKSTYDLTAYYEIYHNLHWENSVMYEDFQYDKDTVGDVQDITLRTGLNLIHNPKWRSGVSLDYTSRSSEDANREYDRIQALLRITKTF